MSLRLVPGAVLCEGFEGELVASVEEAEHAARFDIVDGELWVSCVAGRVIANGVEVPKLARLLPGMPLSVGSTTYLICDSLTEVTGPVPVLVNEAFPLVDQPTPGEAGKLFYEEPMEIEEITITEPVARPHLIAARDRRTGSFPASTVPAEVPPPADEFSAPVARNYTSPGVTQFFRTPTLRIARSQAKSRLPATALMLVGLFAAIGFAAYHLIDRSAFLAWVEEQRASFQAEGQVEATAEAEPFEMIIVDQPQTLQVTPTVSAPSSTATDNTTTGVHAVEFNELTTYAWLRNVNADNHQRFLNLAESLLATDVAADLEEHVTYYASRLAQLNDRSQLEDLTRSFGAVFAGRGEYRGTIADLENRLVALNTHSSKLRAMNEEAARYFEQNALTLPPGNNVVSTAQNMLLLDKHNSDAVRWITRTADLMVQKADTAATSGNTFEARNLIEDVLAFAPDHARANALWLQLAAEQSDS